MTEEMRIARPKGVPAQVQQRDHTMEAEGEAIVRTNAQPEKRGPGRPSIADPFDVLRQVAALLKTTDKTSRRSILETLRDLTE